MVEQVSLASTEYPPSVDEFVKSGLTPIDSDLVKPKRVKESPFQMECKLLEMKSFGNGPVSANLAICEVLKLHIAEDLFTNGVIDPLKIDLVARMSANFYSRAASGIFEVEKPIGKKCIGYDQIPAHIRNSEIYSANDLGKFGNIESIPTGEDVDNFIDQISSEKIEGLEISEEAFFRYERLSDYHMMMKTALALTENKAYNSKKLIELTAKKALSKNDHNFAWKAALYAGKIK
jgi:hypothetical protein